MTKNNFDFGLLIEAEQLAEHLGNEKIRIVDLTRNSVFEQLHVPHAIHLSPKWLVRKDEDAEAAGLLPDQSGLEELIKYLNIGPDHHVVAYDDEGGAWAGRLIWNLHCIGFHNTSLLNGGIHAWLGSNFPTSSEVENFEAVSPLFKFQLDKIEQPRIDYLNLLKQVQDKNVQVWDCRTAEEYTGERLAARRGGHIPSARHFEWSTALNRQNHLKLQYVR